MSKEELLFTDSQLDTGAKELDSLVFQKGPADLVDGPVFRFALGLLNKTLSKHVPDQYKQDIRDSVDLLLAKDYDDAGAKALGIIKTVVSEANMKESVKDVIIGLVTIIQAAIAGLD